MPTIQDLRADYPDLGDLDDEQLVGAVHQALYADLPREKVAAHFGLKPRPAPVAAAAAPAPSGPMRRAADVALSIGKGIIGVPEALVGMANLATGGRAGQLAEQAGVRFKDAKGVLDDLMSPEAKAAQEKFQQSTGVVDAIGTAVTNPSLIVNAAAESLPMMGMGGAIARPLMAAAPRIGALGAAAAGEGITAAGSGAEQIRQQTADGLMTPVQSGVAAVSGAATGLLGVLGGKIAQRMGIADVDTLIAGGAGSATTKGFVRRVLEGAASEGLLEELPQSIQEQVAQNYALGRPLDEGVTQAAVLGALTGGAMGGAVNVFAGKPAGPMQRAAGTVLPPPAGGPTIAPDGTQPPSPTQAPGGKPPAGTPGLDPAGAGAQVLRGGEVVAPGDGAAAVPPGGAPGAQPDPTGVAPPAAAPATTAKALPDAEPREPTDVLNIRGAPFTTRVGAENRRKADPSPDAWRLARVDTGWVLKPATPTTAPQDATAPVQADSGSAAPAPAAVAPTITTEVPDAPVQPPGTDAQTPRAAAPTTETPPAAGTGAAAAAGVPGAGAAPALETPGVAGQPIDSEWTAFAPETGTRGIPRAEMPQVKAEHRGALTQFLKGRGIAHQQEAEVEPGTLKPTQAEFSPAKVRKAREFTGGDRAILVSSDGHVVDGHHQWAAALDDGKPIRVIRLDAPIDDLLPVVKEFPSAEAAGGATAVSSIAPAPEPAPAVASQPDRTSSASTTAPSPIAPTPSSAVEKPEAAQAWWDAAKPADRERILLAAGWKQGSAGTANLRERAWSELKVPQRARVAQAIADAPVAAPAPGPAAAPATRRGPTVIINRLGPDGLTDAERAAGKAPYTDPPAADDEQPAHIKGIHGWWGVNGTAGQADALTIRGREKALEKVGAPIALAARYWTYIPDDVRTKLAALRRDGWSPDAAAPRPAPAPSMLQVLRDRLSPLADRAIEAGDGKLSGQIRGFTIGMKETDPLLTQAWVDEVVAEREKMVRRLEKQRGKATPAAPAPAAPAPRAPETSSASAAPAPSPVTPSANTIVTEDAAERARALLRKKLGQISSGIDPEVLQAGITLAAYHVERGARKFAAYARAMVDDMGDLVKPYLQSWYMAMRSDPAYASLRDGMDKASVVEDLDVDQVLAETTNRTGTTPDVETPAPVADTAPQEAPSDERTDLRGEGPRPLDEMAPGQGGGAEGGGRAGGDAAGGRPVGAGEGARADGAGVPAARGRGGRAGGVRAAAAGGRRRRGAVGDPGTGAAGEGVPEGDARGLNPAPEVAPNIPAQNFRITPDLRLGRGGEVEKFNDNLAAIRTLKQIETERRRATPAEQQILARYVGWGGLANAFPDPISGQFKEKWRDRGAELRDLLDKAEYAAARRSTRNAHYTSEGVVKAMWSAATRLGFRGGLTLESSMGPGNFLGLAPEGVPAKFIGIEYDGLTARIATQLYPQAAVLHTGFQRAPLANNAFALNIGNPPFGSESLRFQYKPELAGVSIHNQFFRAGIDAVRPGGLQIMVVSRFLMDAQDSASRLALARKAKLVAAIRLPDTAFKENARTEVVTDIVILQKLTDAQQVAAGEAIDAMLRGKEKDPSEERKRLLLADNVPDWVHTVEVPDPLGGEPMRVNRYFRTNPRQVLGVMERSGSMQHGADITVRLDDPKALEGMLAEAVERLPEGISQIPDEVLATTEARFKMLADALRIAVANEEPGHLKFDEGGELVRVIDREYPEGGDVMARQTITAASPWSESLSMDAEGRWYKLEVQLGEDGKPVKVEKNGKTTKRNVYTRTVYETEADVPAGLRLGEAGFERLKGIVELRDLLKRQLVLETEDAPAAQMEGNRKKLAAAYEAFTGKHGPINRKGNLALAMTMPDGGLVAALEVQYEPERTAEQAKKSGLEVQAERSTPAPILRERVVPKYEPATGAATGADALAITLAERGRVDMERIAQLRGITIEEATAELQPADKPLVFFDPEANEWQTADAYLSGLVKRKLNAAKAANLDLNVAALEKIQPETWTAENVTAQIGATWVPPDVYADFARHLVGGQAKVSFSALTNSYTLVTEGAEAAKVEQWSAEGAPANYILTRLLNSQAVVVTYTDSEGTTRVDQEATSLAILKSKEIVNEFGDWVFKDGDRRGRLVDIFNEKFNTRVTRQFDGQHLTLPGKVPDTVIAMRRHQKNAIWRGISSRFLLLDHVVGSGKTFTGIARAMERRRMGLARKPTIMVPNHLVEQWAADVYRLYPGAKVLAAGQKDFEPKRRRRLFGKIATGDWDIVIVPHSSFGFIGIAPETEQRFLEAEMRDAQEAIKEAWKQAEEDGQANGRRKPFGVKEAERLAENLQKRMDKIAEGTRDRLLTFEQLGIDDLTVDEAHEFKNLYYSSRLTGVRGMGNKTGSRKAADLYNKVRVLREGGGAVTFMTGTPVSNSAAELFTMMRYLAADELAEQGLTHFDAWRTQYVEATPAFEPTESGRLKEVTRLGRTWSNMRSLMDLYYQFTDAVSNDDIKRWYAEDNGGAQFPVPKVKGGERQLVKMEPTPAQASLLKQTMEDFDALPGIQDPFERNKERLRLMDRARKLSLDIRAVDPRANSTEPNGKLEVAARNIKRIYDQWSADRGTQAVFLDRSVPKAKGDDKVLKEYDDLVAKRDRALATGDDDAYQEAADSLERFDANEMAELRAAQSGGWNAYQQLKDNLVALGIPANEIRFIQEATNDEQKQAMFDAVNGGKVRVLIGSTPRMGAGTNIQQRLVGLHHVDVTWKPSDIEQREGRIIRQGNTLLAKYGDEFAVEILAYATERTVDAKMWDLNATKLRTINGLRNYDGAFTMDIEDEESVSMAEMAALASGNPLLLERVKLESQISTLELQERAHQRKMYGAIDAVDRAKRAIAENPAKIAKARARAAEFNGRVQAVIDRAAARRVTVEGQEFASAPDAMRAAAAAVEAQKAGNENARYAITIDGKRVTSQSAIEEAIGAALGDHVPFQVQVQGRTYTQRTVAGREVAAILSPNLSAALSEPQTVDLGSLFGYQLVADMEKSRWSEGVSISLTLMDGQRTVVTQEVGTQDPFLKVPTPMMRDGFMKLEGRIDPRGDEANADYMEREIERSKRQLPDLEAKVSEKWAKAGELKAKRDRLNEVVVELASGRTKAAEPDVSTNLRQTGAPEANTDDVVFSRGGQANPAEAHRARIEALATAIAAGWANGPRVVVARNMRDPRIPERVRAEDAKQRSAGATGEPEGFFFQGTAYLLTDQLGGARDGVRVLFHESLGHYGLRGNFGQALGPILDRIGVLQAGKVRAKARQYGLDFDKPSERRQAAEEVLAELAQQRPDIGWARKAIAAIRAWAREHIPGFANMKFTDDEIVATFILPARRWVESGPAGSRASLAKGPQIAYAKAGADQRGRDGLTRNAELLARFTESAAFRDQGLRGLDVEAQRLVLQAVAGAIHDDQVRRVVVGLVPVSVVHDLAGKKGPAESLLRDEAVLKDITAINSDDAVALRVDAADALVLATARAAAEQLGATDQRGLSLAGGAAMEAAEGDTAPPVRAEAGVRAEGGAVGSDVLRKANERGTAPGADKIDGTQGVTPNSDGLLGAGSVGALPVPPILGRDQTNTPEFKRWFAGSRVVDAEGKPLVVYHGTASDFSEFKTSKYESGIYFTPSLPYAEGRGRVAALMARGREAGGENVMPVYLRMENPAPAGYGVDRAKAEGFDGLVRGEGNMKEYVVFRPEQIKSAIGNRGTFDPGNADIRFSRSIGDIRSIDQQAIRNHVADLLGGAGAKVSWWQKTVGTQYAKAQKHPGFRRVFDAVQTYLEDVSTLANRAANEAPDILPKLDTWKDLKRSAVEGLGLKPADAAALAGPVFEGTVGYTRGADGRIISTDDADAAAAAMSAEEKARAMVRAGRLSPDVLRMWQGLPIEQFEANVETRYRNEMMRTGVVWTDAELRERFRLTDAQIGHYRQFRAAVDHSLDQLVAADVVRLLGDVPVSFKQMAVHAPRQMRQAVEEYLQQTQPDDTDLWNSVADRFARIDRLKEQGYAPLMRFGKFKVHAVDEAGETQFFGLYETAAEANRMARELRQDPELAGARVTQGVLSQEAYKLFNEVPPESLEMFAEALGAERSAVFQEYLRLAKNNRSALKRLIHRKGTAGFSEDAPRVLASFVTSNARLGAAAMNLPAAKAAAEDIRDGDVKDEAIALVETVQAPKEQAAAIRGLMFMNFIGGSIASAVVNLSQPITMTLPYLSQFGGLPAATKRLMAAAAVVAKGTGEDRQLGAALARAEADGIVSPQEIHHLQAQAMSTWGTHPLARRAAFIWSAPFSLAEQWNRRVSFIAAYNTARERGDADPFGFAEKAVVETQGLYNRGNAANWARNPAGALALQFKQYSVHYMEWMVRMWKSGPEGKKAVGIALLLLAAAGGSDGLPFAEDIDDVVDTIGQALGYDSNFKRWRRKKIAEDLGLGDMTAEVFTRGLSSIPGVPMDVSLRMGMGNLIPATGVLLRSNTDRSRDVLEVAGPAGGLAKQYTDAATKGLEGDFKGAAIGVLPVALQNLAKAIGIWSTGEARDDKGRKVMEADFVDGLMRSLGFNPAEIARESQRMGMIRRSEQLAKNVEGKIVEQWARAIVDKDRDAIAAARAELVEWNKTNPVQPIRITATQVRQRAKKMMQARDERFLKSIAPERRAAAAEAMQ